MTIPPPSPAPVAPTDALPGPKRWRVGTLVYTGPGLVVLFLWLLWGDFAWQMKERAAVPIAPLMLRQFEASDLLVGLLVGSLPSALGLIIGPVVSVWSDRHRGRRGRRIPFLLVPTPFIVAGMVGLAYTPELGIMLEGLLGASSPGANSCRIIVFIFCWGLFEVFTTVANAVFGGLINDVVPAALIGRFFGLFRAVSLVAGVIFNFWIIGHANEHFRVIFLALGVLYGVGFTLMCLRIKEGEYPAPPAGKAPGPLVQAKGYFRECFTHPFYIWLFVALMVANMAGGPVNSFSIFYAQKLGMDMSAYGKLLVATYAISFTLSFFLGWLADKFHPLRIGMAAMLTYGVIMLWGGLTDESAGRFSVVFVIHGVLMGVFLTGTASIGQRLFPAAKFAQFASAAGIFGALGFVLVPPLTGAALDASGHQYQHTFTAGGIIALVACVLFYPVYRRFLALGGDKHYAPPASGA